jgi:hypothetical protein
MHTDRIRSLFHHHPHGAPIVVTLVVIVAILVFVALVQPNEK